MAFESPEQQAKALIDEITRINGVIGGLLAQARHYQGQAATSAKQASKAEKQLSPLLRKLGPIEHNGKVWSDGGGQTVMSTKVVRGLEEIDECA